jgi:GNAT superfamily N-acetyltransferase
VDIDPAALLRSYDSQLRTSVHQPLPAGVTVERDGPLYRTLGLDHGGSLDYRDLQGLRGPDLDTLIARQRDIFRARGERVEWKLHGHDEPADLPERLRAAGFLPEEMETVLIGPAAPLAGSAPALPAGVSLRKVTERIDLDRIARMEEAVWGEPRGWLADGLEKELSADPHSMAIVAAEAAGGAGSAAVSEVVSAGWVRYVAGTDFATLWGGSTLPRFRRQGIYRALVSWRARRALERGVTLLQVDASPNSRPILERLGFIVVTTTTPYVYKP